MMARVRTQPVVGPPARHATFLTLTVAAGTESQVLDVLSDFGGVVRGVSFREPEEQLSAIVGLGAEFWDRAFGAPRPPGLRPFQALEGVRHRAPSTPGDLLFHLRSHRADLCFELGRRILDRLGDAVTVTDEVAGFRYFDERDLLGFVDGTENPTDGDALDAVFVADGPWAGSSTVIVQKYLHDLTAWQQLTVEQQEAAIGRTKLEDVELDDSVKAPDAHIVLNQVERGGVQQKIIRYNLPFGTLADGTAGTYFIGYCADATVTEEMLRNMFLGDGTATHDRILDFSSAITGAQFFVPTVGFLEDPASVLGSAAPGPPAA